MEHLDFVFDLVRENDWFCSIDMADAYFAVNIHPDHWKYLKFIWKGILWEYRVMVFGLSQAPFIFTKLLKPVLAILRSSHLLRCSLYLDDMILMDQDMNSLTQNVQTTVELLSSLGFQINHTKSVFSPTQNIKHLGFFINSRTLTVSVPPEKREHIQNLCKQLISSHSRCIIRDVARVVGSLVAYCQGTKEGRLHYRNLERDKIMALRKQLGNFDGFMSLSNDAMQDLSFWTCAKNYFPRSFRQQPVHFEIFSDASHKGWGGSCNGSKTGGRWQSDELGNHINWLELKAGLLAIQSFASDLSHKHFILRMDNTCAIHYLNNQGGVVASLDSLTKEIWGWCNARNLSFFAAYIPGQENVTADFQSRNFKDNTEWSLNDKEFLRIVETFGIPDIDLFASRLNCKVQKFISWQPDPTSFAVDAFSMDWGKLGLCYAFPPFSLVGKVINKAARDGAELLLVAPSWRSQYWFPLISNYTLEHPLRLSVSRNTIYLAHDKTVSHPIWDKLKLHCFRISGRR